MFYVDSKKYIDGNNLGMAYFVIRKGGEYFLYNGIKITFFSNFSKSYSLLCQNV